MVMFKKRDSILARDIPAFVMYCVNGESGSSLLIESTDSMIILRRLIIEGLGEIRAQVQYFIIIKAIYLFLEFLGLTGYKCS